MSRVGFALRSLVPLSHHADLAVWGESWECHRSWGWGTEQGPGSQHLHRPDLKPAWLSHWPRQPPHSRRAGTPPPRRVGLWSSPWTPGIAEGGPKGHPQGAARLRPHAHRPGKRGDQGSGSRGAVMPGQVPGFLPATPCRHLALCPHRRRDCWDFRPSGHPPGVLVLSLQCPWVHTQSPSLSSLYPIY